jgi:hypothetical protein
MIRSGEEMGDTYLELTLVDQVMSALSRPENLMAGTSGRVLPLFLRGTGPAFIAAMLLVVRGAEA